MKKTKAKTKTYTPFYKDWTFIILAGILILMLICYIYRSVKPMILNVLPQTPTEQEKSYNKNHEQYNTPTPFINYDKLSSDTKNHLHVDSYDIKDNKRIYYDSLLERYSYYSDGNANLVNSYVGSHGVISPTDKITSINGTLFNRSKAHIALSKSPQYSALNLDLWKLVDYTNRFRILNIYGSLRGSGGRNYDDGKTYHLMKLHNANDVGQDGDCIFYFIRDCAPNECAGLSDFMGNYYPDPPAHYAVPQELKNKYHVKWCAPIFMNLAQSEDTYDDGDSFSYSNWEYTYLNGSPLSKSLKQPKDPTRKFTRGIISANEFNSKRHYSNKLYSNGNSYFLQLMYKNYENMSNNNSKSRNFNSNYKFIDAYRKGWHINPIMFNDFVRQPNTYNSPYLFNYTIGDDMACQNIKPMSQTMLNYIEHQDYNLPCNYDNNHYYYRTIEGTLVRDDNIKSVNNGQNVFIMGNPSSSRKMPTGKNSLEKEYYSTSIEYQYARKYNDSPVDASQFLNYKRYDCGFEPLWMIGLINDSKIGTYHPGEMVKFAGVTTDKPVSHYYIVDNGQKHYIPTYKIHGHDCFKAICTFKGQTKNYVLAKDAYMLKGNVIQHN